MRLVLDTNTVISALFWKGTPHRLVAAARDNREIVFYTTARLLAELADVIDLARKILRSCARRKHVSGRRVTEIHESGGIITPASMPPVIITDPDDSHVLACALAAQADLIVSGDSDLLNLKRYQGIDIVTAGEALARVAKTGG